MVKHLSASAGDMSDVDSIPAGKILGIEMATHSIILVWYPWIEGAWWATIHGLCKESDMTEHTLRRSLFYTETLSGSFSPVKYLIH